MGEVGVNRQYKQLIGRVRTIPFLNTAFPDIDDPAFYQGADDPSDHDGIGADAVRYDLGCHGRAFIKGEYSRRVDRDRKSAV